ncbi:MAG: hypothetical protein OEQ18_02615 [Gammaproteobacteria bacterium]|nr:hypothetical protein [Gammaproteobacteria bacterium]
MHHSSNPKRQRGFFAIGIGIALLAVFGGVSLGIKHVAQSEQTEINAAARSTPVHETTPTDVAYSESGE